MYLYTADCLIVFHKLIIIIYLFTAIGLFILHVNKTRNWLLLNLNRESYMRSM